METIEGRNYNVLELPYSKDRVWILERVKVKDMQALEGKDSYAILESLVKKVERDDKEVPFEVGELDLIDANFLADYVSSLTTVDREAKKK